MKVMFRAVGYNGQDQVVHYDTPRAEYEHAEADVVSVSEMDGVYSVSVEKRFVPDEVELVPAELAEPVETEKKPAKKDKPAPADAPAAPATGDAAGGAKD